MNIARQQGSGLLAVSGTLDITTADALRDALLEGFSNNAEVDVDLAGIERCDTAGLQVLLAGGRNGRHLGKPLRLHSISASIAEVAVALGFSIDISTASIVEAHGK